MTPKEKAKELVNKFLDTDDGINIDNGCGITMFQAKECAIIAVDEIMNITPSVYVTNDEEISIFHYQYWQDVKTEIELL